MAEGVQDIEASAGGIPLTSAVSSHGAMPGPQG